MRFATVKEVIAMVVVWAATLCGIDRIYNPVWPPPAAIAADGVTLRLWIGHLCCTGCLADAVKALRAVPCLGPPTPPPGILSEGKAKERTEGLANYGGYIDVPVKDVSRLDLVMVDRVLRDVGLVPKSMEISGLTHFRLVAEVPHMCCGMCKAGAEDGMNYVKGQLAWLNSVTVTKERKSIIAYAKFAQPGQMVDIGEFLAALNFIGFAPSSVKLRTGPENSSS